MRRLTPQLGIGIHQTSENHGLTISSVEETNVHHHQQQQQQQQHSQHTIRHQSGNGWKELRHETRYEREFTPSVTQYDHYHQYRQQHNNPYNPNSTFLSQQHGYGLDHSTSFNRLGTGLGGDSWLDGWADSFGGPTLEELELTTDFDFFNDMELK